MSSRRTPIGGFNGLRRSIQLSRIRCALRLGTSGAWLDERLRRIKEWKAQYDEKLLGR